MRIEFSRKAAKFIEKADKQTGQRLFLTAGQLVHDPFPRDAKRVENQWFEEEKIFRIRVGNFRVLYTVNYQRDRVLVFDIDKRETAY